MYESFFGFTERPFQLVPNPAYLFLSSSHEEALAHLRYAASQGDGFVAITGEVGTGKTTLCRAFLDTLGPEAEVAYIFNPRLTPVQLLKSVNEELGLPAEAESTQELIPHLNHFLLQKKSEGQTVLLLIDEAQNLSRETLEQLRLISNLETRTSKLIQIILVGQPELRELLNSPAMRQLNQRITLSFHLAPLTFAETRDYIQHRLWVASRQAKSIITPWACYAMYRFSRGIPRLINMACDRALLTAFGSGNTKVTFTAARRAIRELHLRNHFRPGFFSLKTRPWLPAGLAFVLITLSVSPYTLFPDPYTESEKPPTHIQKIAQPDPQEAETIAGPAPPRNQRQETVLTSTLQRSGQHAQPDPVSTLTSPPNMPTSPADYLRESDPLQSRQSAVQAILSQWGGQTEISPQENITDPETFFRASGAQNGLLTLRIQDGIGLLKKLNLPAILECTPPQGTEPVYMALTAVRDDRLIFEMPHLELTIQASEQELDGHWQGVAYILWKNVYHLEGTLPRDHSKKSLINLKQLLREIGFHNLGQNPAFDAQTRKAVQRIQARHGLQVDGLVGPRTKIALYNELPNLQLPHLISTRKEGTAPQ